MASEDFQGVVVRNREGVGQADHHHQDHRLVTVHPRINLLLHPRTDGARQFHHQVSTKVAISGDVRNSID